MAKRRGSHKAREPTEAVNRVVAEGSHETDVNPPWREPSVNPAWQHVVDFISRPSNNPRMTNLEKLQAIAQSLGKYADDVWFGTGGLTMGDIGRVLNG